MPAQLAASRAGALKSGSSSDHRSYQRVEAALQALGTDGAMPGGGGRSGEQPGGHDHAEFLVAAEVADFEPVAVVDQRRDPARSGQPAIEAVLVRGIVLEEQALLVPYLPGACVAPVGAALVQEQGRRPRRAGGGPRPRDLRGVGDPALVARLGDRAAGLVARSVAAEPRRRAPDRRRGHLPPVARPAGPPPCDHRADSRGCGCDRDRRRMPARFDHRIRPVRSRAGHGATVWRLVLALHESRPQTLNPEPARHPDGSGVVGSVSSRVMPSTGSVSPVVQRAAPAAADVLGSASRLRYPQSHVTSDGARCDRLHG